MDTARGTSHFESLPDLEQDIRVFYDRRVRHIIEAGPAHLHLSFQDDLLMLLLAKEIPHARVHISSNEMPQHFLENVTYLDPIPPQPPYQSASVHCRLHHATEKDVHTLWSMLEYGAQLAVLGFNMKGASEKRVANMLNAMNPDFQLDRASLEYYHQQLTTYGLEDLEQAMGPYFTVTHRDPGNTYFTLMSTKRGG